MSSAGSDPRGVSALVVDISAATELSPEVLALIRLREPAAEHLEVCAPERKRSPGVPSSDRRPSSRSVSRISATSTMRSPQSLALGAALLPTSRQRSSLAAASSRGCATR